MSLFEHQESLEISSTTGSLTVRDLDLGRTETGPLDGDPRLLNRKLDIEWELTGLGAEARWSPKLPSLRLANWAPIEPTLSFHALAADFDLHFDNRREPETSTSLHGRGPLFGVDLETTTSLCRACPWFAGAGYRYQTLPKTDVETSPSFSDPSFRVLNDVSRLSRDTHDVYSYVGYSPTGSRIRSYLGVRSRRMDVEIENGLEFLNPQLRQETELSYRTRLESSQLQGIAGVYTDLGGRLFARAELAAGGGDETVSLMVALQPSAVSGLFKERHLRKIALALAPRIAQILAEFRAGRKALTVTQPPGEEPAYLAREVGTLLRRTEDDLLSALRGYPELKPLTDWVQTLFEDAREGLESTAANSVTQSGAHRIALAASSGATWVALRLSSQDSSNAGVSALIKRLWDQKLDRVESGIKDLAEKTRDGKLAFLFTFKAPSGQLRLWTGSETNPVSEEVFSPGEKRLLVISIYSFRYSRFICDAKTPGRSTTSCPLNLVQWSGSVLPMISCDPDPERGGCTIGAKDK